MERIKSKAVISTDRYFAFLLPVFGILSVLFETWFFTVYNLVVPVAAFWLAIVAIFGCIGSCCAVFPESISLRIAGWLLAVFFSLVNGVSSLSSLILHRFFYIEKEIYLTDLLGMVFGLLLPLILLAILFVRNQTSQPKAKLSSAPFLQLLPCVFGVILIFIGYRCSGLYSDGTRPLFTTLTHQSFCMSLYLIILIGLFVAFSRNREVRKTGGLLLYLVGIFGMVLAIIGVTVIWKCATTATFAIFCAVAVALALLVGAIGYLTFRKQTD